MAVVSVNVGDVCEFLYPDGSWISHRFYTDFPYGRRAPAFEPYVDMYGTLFEVLQVRSETFDGVEYVGVQFQARNGMLLWTNFSKDDDVWLKVV